MLTRLEHLAQRSGRIVLIHSDLMHGAKPLHRCRLRPFVPDLKILMNAHGKTAGAVAALEEDELGLGAGYRAWASGTVVDIVVVE
jgi:hypothetical protein